MQRSRFGLGLIWALSTVIIAGIAGVIGYSIGLGATVTAGGVVAPHFVYGPMGWGWGFFPFFGLLFGAVFFVLIFGLIRRAAWGGYRGYGPGGPGAGSWSRSGWDRGDPPPAGDGSFEDLHRRAHGDTGTTTSAPAGPVPETGTWPR